jgi:hypothetical protein
MRHQAMCDDKAATSILPFNVQQKSNSSLQTTTARYDHHHANTSVRLAWHLLGLLKHALSVLTVTAHTGKQAICSYM